MKLSVVIPTHRRAEILRACLRSIERQTVASQLEVIVVSDGHDDKTAALFVKQPGQRSSQEWSIPVHYLEIAKSQQGTARNAGVAIASGERVLFIGDDIFLAPDACEHHLEGPYAVLGHTTWDPDIGITPVMRWLERSGWQFGYPTLSRLCGSQDGGEVPASVQHRFTYTSHISLPLEIAKKLLFRTDIHLYGWEDIEWGMRLRKAGVRLFYRPAAKALHHQHMTLQDSLARMQILGRSAVLIKQQEPSFDRVPMGWKLLAYCIAALLPTMAGRHRRAFLRGLSIANKAI